MRIEAFRSSIEKYVKKPAMLIKENPTRTYLFGVGAFGIAVGTTSSAFDGNAIRRWISKNSSYGQEYRY